VADAVEDDFRWLIGAGARPYLELARESAGGLVGLASRLRQDLSAARTHLVLETSVLRLRAKEKFARADEMFFTRRLLEQATDDCIAAYKSMRRSPDLPFADLCCGLGGDLLGWGARGPCRGLDLDPIAALLARANCAVHGLPDIAVETRDVVELELPECGAWHIDPDRRHGGRRSSQPIDSQPNLAALEQLLARQPHGSVKFAPAAQPPEHWSEQCEREWIGSRRECRQQVAWFGRFTTRPGMRRATVVDRGAAPCSVAGFADTPTPVTERAGRLVLDPHAAVFAARLSGALCAEHGIFALRNPSGYLTGDSCAGSRLLAAFEVLDVLPQRQVGRLEVKVRCAKIDPVQLTHSLNLRGDRELTLLVAGPVHGMRAILARRLPGST
jgi:hypothetical protein